MIVKIIQEYSLNHNKIRLINIVKYNNELVISREDSIAIESPLEIRLGYHKGSFQTLAITLCSPDEIVDLVYGQLYSEGIISHCSDVLSIQVFDNELGLIAEVILLKSIDYNKYLNKRHGMIHASCGICGKTEIDDLLTFQYTKNKQPIKSLSTHEICMLPEKLCQSQLAFKETGGVHACALFDKTGELLLLKEDVGRHNALDKLIGRALLQKLLPLSNKTILLSGRVSFELVHKALISGVTTLAAIGAPSSLSIEIAQANNLRLLGFVKNTGFNEYCNGKIR